MNKPSNFKGKVYIKPVRVSEDEDRFHFMCDLGEPYGFSSDSECGNQFYIGYDTIYENLKSRLIFLLKRLKEENFIVEGYKITATIYDSNINGVLL